MSLTVLEAQALVQQHLGKSARAEHSFRVARLLRRYAALLKQDADLWQVIGLCHDLDYEVTRNTPARHGLLVLDWLGERIPDLARDAIAGHDHQTGFVVSSLLGDMLKLADAVDTVLTRYDSSAVSVALRARDPFAALRSILADRPYLSDMVERIVTRHGLKLEVAFDLEDSGLRDQKVDL
jgi:hypothetical protein